MGPQFKNYYLEESKLDKVTPEAGYCIHLVWWTRRISEFDATVIDYGIDGVDNSYIISTTQKKFSDYPIVSHRIPYFQGGVLSKTPKADKVKNIAEKYLDSQKAIFLII